MGGSITWGSSATDRDTLSYRALTGIGLNNGYPAWALNHYNAGVGGTDSWYALVRLQVDVIARSPSLVVIEFAVNDIDTLLRRQAAEALVRRLRVSLPNAKLVFIGFPEITDNPGNDPTNVKANTLATWIAICSGYSIPVYDWAARSKALVDASIYTCAQLWLDTKHPLDLGHADAANQFLPYLANGLLASGMQWSGDIGDYSYLYDNGDLEATPIIRTGVDNDGETGVWSTDAPSTRKSIAAGATIEWSGTFSTFGLEASGAVGAATWNIDGGDETPITLTGYNYPQLVSTAKIARAAHTVTLTVVSGVVAIVRFLAI